MVDYWRIIYWGKDEQGSESSPGNSMSTVFDRVVTKENDHTHLLRNIMERHPKAAAAILYFLLNRDTSETEAASLEFRAQYPFSDDEGREIPDILVEGKDFRCLIEAKIDPWLGLTDGQRRGYPACLNREGELHLVFLVPSDWKHIESAKQVESILPANVKVHIKHWRDLIESIEPVSKSLTDGVLAEAIAFWKGWFQMERLTVQERESLMLWRKEEFSAFRKLEQTVDKAKRLFDARGFETEFETVYSESYGFYIKRAKAYLLYIGVWARAPVPLSLSFRTTSSTWLKPANLPSEPMTSPNAPDHLFWSLEPETWDDPEKVYAKVKSFLDSYKTD
jgi:hypothetical protein